MEDELEEEEEQRRGRRGKNREEYCDRAGPNSCRGSLVPVGYTNRD